MTSAAKADQAAVGVGAAMLVKRQLVDLVIEFETAPCNPVGMASGQRAQIGLIGAVAGAIAIAQNAEKRHSGSGLGDRVRSRIEAASPDGSASLTSVTAKPSSLVPNE